LKQFLPSLLEFLIGDKASANRDVVDVDEGEDEWGGNILSQLSHNPRLLYNLTFLASSSGNNKSHTK